MSDALDRTVLAVGEHVRRLLRGDDAADRAGFLQAVTPAVTVVGLVALLVFAVSRRRLAPLAVVGAAAVALGFASRLTLRALLVRVVPVAATAAVVIAPRAVMTEGPALVGPVTEPGALAAAVFVARVSVCATLVALLLSTTRFRDLLAGLRRLRVPAVAVSLVAVTHRYLLVFFAELSRAARARRGRRIGTVSLRREWREAGALVGTLFVRALERGEGVQRAARARGGGRPTVQPSRAPLGSADLAFGVAVAAVVVLGVAA